MNSTELIAAVREIATTTNDPDYLDADILRLLNRALLDRFKHSLITSRQGFWRQKALIPITANQANYRVPRRAVDGIVEMVEIQYSAGGDFYPLTNRTPGQVTRNQGPGTPVAYAIDGDSINIRPTPTDASATLRVTYFLTPPTLVLPESNYLNGYVIGTNITNRTVNVANINVTIRDSAGPPPVGASAFIVGNHVLDIVRADGTYETSLVEVANSGVASNVISFPVGTDISRVQYGDRVRQAGYSEWPQLPEGLHQALADYTAGVVLLNKGDREKAKDFAGKAADAIDRTVDVITPRAKAQQPTLTPRYSFLRRGRR